MRSLVIYYSSHTGQLAGIIVNSPDSEDVIGPDSASQLIGDLGADTVTAVVELPDGDFRPELTDGETGEEMPVRFIDI